MAELPRTEEGQVALPPTAAEMGREAAEQTVREQLVEALEAWKVASAAEDLCYRKQGLNVRQKMYRLYEEAERQTDLALDRARTEPECGDACGSECPCYIAGTEAQREPIGGGRA